MDHNQAVKEMAAERYLLGELEPDARDAFEEHAFDCPTCALDLRAGAAFVDEAKVQLPDLTKTPAQQGPVLTPPATGKPKADKSKTNRDGWLSWLRPAFSVPAFAAMLLALGYQNLVTMPALRAAATQPRLMAFVPALGATRGEPGVSIPADRQQGVALPVDLSPQTGAAPYATYTFDLFDPQGKLVWTGITAPPADSATGGRVLLAIPGATLHSGAYTVSVSGIGSSGERTLIDKYSFNLAFKSE